MTTELAFDISAWQGQPPPSWFRSMKALGYSLCWIQLWGLTPTGNGPNPYAAYQLSQASAAGMETGGYIVVYGDATNDTSILVKVAKDAAGAEAAHLKFVALDLETAPIRMARLLNAYDNIGTQFPGVTRAMYTSRRKWSVAFGTAAWPHAATTPLLEARYWFNSGSAPATPPPLEWFWLPFGGWTERAMLQYAGTVPTGTPNVGVDRCVYDRERMMYGGAPSPTPQPDGGELTMGQYEDLLNAINAVSGRVAKVEGTAHSHSAPAPAPTPTPAPAPVPAPLPSGDFVIVKSGDLAGNWFATEADLLQLNPDFKTLAFRSDGSIMRRFTSRSWGDIYPPERLRIRGTPAPAPAPAPTPAPTPAKEYVIVKRGDMAGNWFATERALLALNPNFPTLAYRSDGSIMRRFSGRRWGDIYPPERLRIK